MGISHGISLSHKIHGNHPGRRKGSACLPVSRVIEECLLFLEHGGNRFFNGFRVVAEEEKVSEQAEEWLILSLRNKDGHPLHFFLLIGEVVLFPDSLDGVLHFFSVSDGGHRKNSPESIPAGNDTGFKGNTYPGPHPA